MAVLLKKLYQSYVQIFQEDIDPRVNFTILASPTVFCSLLIGYLYFVKSFGPKWMKNKKPFNIRNSMIIYNILQVVLNAYLVYRAFRILWRLKTWMPPECMPVSQSSDPDDLDQVYANYVYLILKFLDLIDTVFFVLRKSERQITFLHVYHHGLMLTGTWAVFIMIPGGEMVWVGFVNGIVHVFMFSYYLLTAIDSRWKNSIRLKKALTQMQLMQFTFFFQHFLRVLFDTECSYPRWMTIFFIPQNLFMIFLFGDFYYKTYISTPKKQKNVLKQE